MNCCITRKKKLDAEIPQLENEMKQKQKTKQNKTKKTKQKKQNKKNKTKKTKKKTKTKQNTTKQSKTKKRCQIKLDISELDATHEHQAWR